MSRIKISPATVAAIFSLGMGLAVCFWGYGDFVEAYRDHQQTVHSARPGISRPREHDPDAVSNAEQEPELNAAGTNGDDDALSPNVH
jgi:hypothetical protein